MGKPKIITPELANIPSELTDLPQWVVWKYHFHNKRKVWIKLPLTPTSDVAASTTNPLSWGTFEEAAMAYEFVGGYDGIGFVFAEGGGLVGIDIDDCLDAGKPTAMAQEILAKIPGFVEVSPSGNGLHIITKGQLGRAYKDDSIGLELYEKSRYFCITGRTL